MKFTQKAILDTFEEMLETMPFDKITVTALVNQCGISSNTFYYHYRDIYDLLEDWLQQNLGGILELPMDQWKEPIKQVLLNCQQHKKVVHNVAHSLSRERLEMYLFRTSDKVIKRSAKKYMADMNLSEQRKKKLTEFFSYSMLGCFVHFIWGDMDEDVNELVDELNHLYQLLIKALLDEQSETLQQL